MEITRRNALKIIGATPVAAGLGIGGASAEQARAAHEHPAAQKAATAARKGQYKPKFFTAHEWATVTLLADIIIPKDERSGSASDAGVPEFIDFIMTDRPNMQTQMRGGLRWLDAACRKRFSKAFVDLAATDRASILDEIAYPKKAAPEISQGAAFFTAFRNLVATGFYTSKIGIADLGYMGNVPTVWNGCPQECLDHLGLKA
jgi:gluconate 2-dehydrogenase gamma chain